MSKRIVICADGTWNDPEDRDDLGQPSLSNVVKISAAILPEDANGKTQIVYYQKGVGERGGLWDHISGGAFGVGISRNIEELYMFLANNYSPSDEIFLFGFSRGAYTVRSLGGLIYNCGILRRENSHRYGEAYDIYRSRDEAHHPTAETAQKFKQQYSWPAAKIHFIGVWDTVGALGIPVTPLRFWTKKLVEFHDTKLGPHVQFAYQALAIDEKRKPFLPSVWQKSQAAPAEQVIEQAWFPGVHCDVGGGYADANLSDNALLWLWEHAEKAGLALEPNRRPLSTNADGNLHNSMTLYYRVLGNGIRTLGEKNPAGHENVSESTNRRMQNVPGYRPPNLLRFMDQR